MKNNPIARREALRHLAILSASAALPAFLATACSRKPSCLDVTGLSPEDLKMRNETAAYTEVAPDPSKKCNNCAQWVPAASPTACGGCKVIKGPINPDGWCKLYVPPAG